MDPDFLENVHFVFIRVIIFLVRCAVILANYSLCTNALTNPEKMPIHLLSRGRLKNLAYL